MGGRQSKQERSKQERSIGTTAPDAAPSPQTPLMDTSSSEGEGRQLQHRLDVRAEISLFAARPLLLWAFQTNKKQLQAIFGPRPSPLHVTASKGCAFGSQFGAKQRQSFVTCSRLCVTLAARLMYFQSACAVTHPLRQAACILSRRHELRWRLGGVAAAGAGFVRLIGRKGDGNGEFQHPYGVVFDSEGNLVVCDHRTHRIQVLRYIDGAHLRTIGSEGIQNGLFKGPCIAFDDAGHIIVAESGNNRVQVLRYSDGAHVRTIGSEGSGNGQFDWPSSIAVDDEGNVAVFSRNGRVQVHRLSDGAYIRTIGSEGSGNGQFARGYGGVAFDGEGNLVVADGGNHRVQVLRYSDGAHLRTIGSEGKGAGQFQSPVGVAFDAAGHIVVVEKNNYRVQVLRYSDGAHVRTIGSSLGVCLGEFCWPMGISIDSDGRIVVADTFNHRVQVLE
jgi:DNA-binding beta-propeller fold protein YncE